ncbi:MAG: hypothetical protein ABSD92_13970 [Candidatus Bathyarchaeia archaeon]|jgi:hypothetical protein
MNKFNENINRDSITEFWYKWKEDKYQDANKTMLEAIEEQLGHHSLKIQTDTEKLLVKLLCDALLATQNNRNFSKMNKRNFSNYAKNP